MNVFTDNSQDSVNMAWLSSGARFVVTWRSQGDEDGSNYNIYARMYDGNTGMRWMVMIISCPK